MSYSPMSVNFFNGKGLYSSTGIFISPYSISVGTGADKKIYDNSNGATIVATINGTLTAGKWYAICLKESDGTISAIRAGTHGSWSTWTQNTETANQLACSQIYSYTYNYMRDSLAASPTVYYRILGVCLINGGATGCSFIKTIRNIPPSYVKANTATAQSLANSGNNIVNFDTIIVDINAEFSTGAACKWTPWRSMKWSVSGGIILASGAWTATAYLQGKYALNGSTTRYTDYFVCEANVTKQYRIRYDINDETNYTDYIQFYATHNRAAGAIALSGTALENYIVIQECLEQ